MLILFARVLVCYGVLGCVVSMCCELERYCVPKVLLCLYDPVIVCHCVPVCCCINVSCARVLVCAGVLQW
jgi:hypothetical protein